MDAIRHGSISAHAACPRCGQPVPLTGPALSVRCPHCASDVEVRPAVWAHLLGALDEAHEELAGSRSRATTEVVEGRPLTYELAAGLPACGGCGKPLQVADIANGAHRNLTCFSCGHPSSTEPAPEWLVALVPTARQLFLPDPRPDLGSALPLPLDQDARPIVLQCPQCGGTLRASTADGRLLACPFCRADVYLPDEVWRRLHPERTARPFFVRFEGATRRELRRRLEEQRAREAEVMAREREQVRERAAAERRRSIDAQTRLAWVFALVLLPVLAAPGALGWLARARPALLGDARDAILLGLGGAALLYLVVTTWAVTRPLLSASRHAGEWAIFVTWFWLPFALLFPVLGQLLALVRAFVLLRGRIGASTISSGDGSHAATYAAVRFEHGESRPAGVVFLQLALAWPAVVLGVVGPERLLALLG